MSQPEKLRIGIDARLITYRRGIGNFVQHLLDALARLDTQHEFVLYVDSQAAVPLAPVHPRFTTRVVGPPIYPVWEQFSLPAQLRRDRIDVLHCPANAAPLRMPRSTRLVLTIHDVMYMLPRSTLPASPSLYQRIGRGYLRWAVPRVARHAAAVTTISEFSRADIARYITTNAPMTVVYEAPGPAFRMLDAERAAATVRALGVTSPYMFALAALDPRKNTARVIDAFARALPNLHASQQLVLVGLAPGARVFFGKQLRALGIESRVLLLGFVTEDELVALYNAAELFVYASLYEGFGMPLLEAMACGTAVLASTSASVPEIAGDAALLVDPTDVAAIADAMSRLSTDAPSRMALKERGRVRAKRFTWEQVARDVMTVYEQAGSA